ncbi:50S ribosomal protein L20 [Candidatus Tremblaya princeps]|uniref:50S ribosomal protein L20 n=1 Tax=Tremblaya princeps TaxID=189385 RepID=A0A1C3K8Z2_TREPR|nr:50S ribosomal protein L20 [Candidatus Tremblaya princeps]SBT62998.1 50S ribosomal protein L20 [Candidatus Tremblaya princeps]
MPRVKRGVAARSRHSRIVRLARGYRGRRGSVYRVAMQAVTKARRYAYYDRRLRKRYFRALWIMRIGVAAREAGTNYSTIIGRMARERHGICRCTLAALTNDTAEKLQYDG